MPNLLQCRETSPIYIRKTEVYINPMSYYLYPWLGCNLRLHNTLGLFYLFRPMDYESMNKMPTFPEHITSFFFHVGNNNYRDGKTKKKKKKNQIWEYFYSEIAALILRNTASFSNALKIKTHYHDKGPLNFF